MFLIYLSLLGGLINNTKLNYKRLNLFDVESFGQSLITQDDTN